MSYLLSYLLVHPETTMFQCEVRETTGLLVLESSNNIPVLLSVVMWDHFRAFV